MKVFSLLALAVASCGIFLSSGRSEETAEAQELSEDFKIDVESDETIDDAFAVNDVPNADKGDKEDNDENMDGKQKQGDLEKENDEASDSNDITTSDTAVKEIETDLNEQDEPSMAKRFFRRRLGRRLRRRLRRFFKKIRKGVRKVGKGVKKVVKKIHKGAKKVCKFVKVINGKVGKVCRFVDILGDEELQPDKGEFEDELTQRDLDKIKEDKTSKELMR